MHPEELGVPAWVAPQDPDGVPRAVGKLLGRRHFEDSLGACVFTTRTSVAALAEAVSAATGWDYSKDEAMRFGRRVAAILRVFNIRYGIGPELERPSVRYGSVPLDGPAAGVASQPVWDHMVDTWYRTVGYDRPTGLPLPDVLDELGLGDVRTDVWGGPEERAAWPNSDQTD